MPSTYQRRRHCRGFYESSLSQCRYCGKNVPMTTADGSPKIFPDRATCRALQIAEFEQLPPEAHQDCFRPDSEVLDRLCSCLHCPPGTPSFEAVEMRWLANERMWACPCTTCGGRGFTFDIHLSEPLWQCADCHHWYAPPNGDARASNAKCPKCGCTLANGWFDDEYEEDSDEALAEEFSQSEDAVMEDESPSALAQEPLPWEQDAQENAFSLPEGIAYAIEHPTTGTIPDDIDYPREVGERPDPPSHPGGEKPGEDDIPW